MILLHVYNVGKSVLNEFKLKSFLKRR